LFQQLKLHCSPLFKDPLGRLCKRLFLENGTELTEPKQLRHEMKLWVSYGEPFRSSKLLVLSTSLQSTQAILLQDGAVRVATVSTMEDTHAYKGADWNVLEGYPDNLDALCACCRAVAAQGHVCSHANKAGFEFKNSFLSENHHMLLSGATYLRIKGNERAPPFYPNVAVSTCSTAIAPVHQQWIISPVASRKNTVTIASALIPGLVLTAAKTGVLHLYSIIIFILAFCECSIS
jgi:hypothetical protein